MKKSSGGKTPIKQPTSDDFNTVMENAANYEGNNDALSMYLIRAEEDGKITQEESNHIYDMYSVEEEKGGIAANAGKAASAVASAVASVASAIAAGSKTSTQEKKPMGNLWDRIF